MRGLRQHDAGARGSADGPAELGDRRLQLSVAAAGLGRCAGRPEPGIPRHHVGSAGRTGASPLAPAGRRLRSAARRLGPVRRPCGGRDEVLRWCPVHGRRRLAAQLLGQRPRVPGTTGRPGRGRVCQQRRSPGRRRFGGGHPGGRPRRPVPRRLRRRARAHRRWHRTARAHPLLSRPTSSPPEPWRPFPAPWPRCPIPPRRQFRPMGRRSRVSRRPRPSPPGTVRPHPVRPGGRPPRTRPPGIRPRTIPPVRQGVARASPQRDSRRYWMPRSPGCRSPRPHRPRAIRPRHRPRAIRPPHRLRATAGTSRPRLRHRHRGRPPSSRSSARSRRVRSLPSARTASRRR